MIIYNAQKYNLHIYIYIKNWFFYYCKNAKKTDVYKRILKTKNNFRTDWNILLKKSMKWKLNGRKKKLYEWEKEWDFVKKMTKNYLYKKYIIKITKIVNNEKGIYNKKKRKKNINSRIKKILEKR